MDKKLLLDLIESNKSTREIGKVLGKSQTDVRYWLKKFNLKTKKKQYNRKLKVCKICGENNQKLFYKSCSTYCKSCDSDRVRNLQRNNKKKAIEYKGGKCEKCGYHRCDAALDFHHCLGEKDKGLHSLMMCKWERIEKELKKCILVCANCHREIHYALDD